mgnify:CR=1 FL=1
MADCCFKELDGGIVAESGGGGGGGSGGGMGY